MMRKYIFSRNTCIYAASALLCVSLAATAGDITAINAYQMMSGAPPNSKTFMWNGPVNAVVSATTQNWNKPVAEAWAVVSNRNLGLIKRYSESDPGFTAPNNESYGIEVEFGDTTIPPRSPNSKNIRFYTDFGQTGIVNSGADRAEIHIRSTLETLNVKEGTTLWVGWSEYFTHLDRKRHSTLFQFRNQPNERTLKKSGFTQSEIDTLAGQDLITGGPASAIEAKPIGANLHFHFATRSGTPAAYTSSPNERQHTRNAPIETGKWYDFVLQIKYSQQADGRFRVWVYEAAAGNAYAVTDPPEWDFVGSTMYSYPSGYSQAITAPQFRYGTYRYNAKNATDITDQDRYMVKYAGPMRLWVGDGDKGFQEVAPR